MNKKIDSVKKFVSKHRVAIAVGATIAVTTTAHIMIVKQFNDFLTEKDLIDEYYMTEED